MAKSGSIGDLAELPAAMPPIPKEELQENIAVSRNSVSRRPTSWLIALYFLATLIFSFFYVRMSAPFARFDYLRTFGFASGLFLVSGILPMIPWAFLRFRPESARGTMGLWCLFLIVFAVFDWQGAQFERDLEIEQIGKTAFTREQRDEVGRIMKNSCIETWRKTPGITGEQMNSYCGCTAAAVAPMLTSEEFDMPQSKRHTRKVCFKNYRKPRNNAFISWVND